MAINSIQITHSYIKIGIIYIYSILRLSYLRYFNHVAIILKRKEVRLPDGKVIFFMTNKLMYACS
jgi:hypothetical protein